MKNDHEIADRIAQCLALINERIQTEVLAQMVTEDGSCAFGLGVDAALVRRLREVLSDNPQLWIDLKRAVQSHRTATHWLVLLEHAVAIGQLQEKLTFVERRCIPSAHARPTVAELLNCMDGEIAFCRDSADRRDLAARINKHADFPLIDGLTLRGLTYIFGEQADVWRDFQELVDGSAHARDSIKDTGLREQ